MYANKDPGKKNIWISQITKTNRLDRGLTRSDAIDYSITAGEGSEDSNKVGVTEIEELLLEIICESFQEEDYKADIKSEN